MSPVFCQTQEDTSKYQEAPLIQSAVKLHFFRMKWCILLSWFFAPKCVCTVLKRNTLLSFALSSMTVRLISGAKFFNTPCITKAVNQSITNIEKNYSNRYLLTVWKKGDFGPPTVCFIKFPNDSFMLAHPFGQIAYSGVVWACGLSVFWSVCFFKANNDLNAAESCKMGYWFSVGSVIPAGLSRYYQWKHKQILLIAPLSYWLSLELQY